METRGLLALGLLVGGALMLSRSVPRGVRNNNPGNLRYFPSINWHGQVGPDADGYAVFETPIAGARAMYIDLRTGFRRDGEDTVREIIAEWAPASDGNPTDAYVEFVARSLGVSPDRVLSLYESAVPLMQAITRFEQGFQPYTREFYELAVEAAQ